MYLKGGTMEDINDLVGTTIKKKYYVEKLIGKGGMGWVYLVKHKKLGNRWAMKVIKKKKTEGKLYKKEVEILEHINHPNIPQIIAAIWDVFTAVNWLALGKTIVTVPDRS